MEAMQQFLKSVYDLALTAGLKLIGGIVLVIVGFKLTKLLTKRLERSKGFQKIEAGVGSFIRSFISIGLKVLILLTAASLIGVPMTNMVAILGSAGLALGLALQGSLSNFAGGLMILIFKPFRVGDYIQSGGDAGTVKAISILYTELLTLDNCRIVIPNGSLSNAVIKDYSVESTRRVDLEFSVAYHSDIDQVRRVLLDVAESHELILKDPKPEVYLKDHGDSALIFVFRAWTQTPNYWAVYFAVNERAKKAFDANGIEIPFPQLDVHTK